MLVLIELFPRPTAASRRASRGFLLFQPREKGDSAGVRGARVFLGGNHLRDRPAVRSNKKGAAFADTAEEL